MVTLAIILLCVNVVLWIFLYLRLDKRFNAATMLERVRDEVNSITLEINKEIDIRLTLLDARKTELRELLAQVERQMTLANESLDRLEGEGRLFSTAPGAVSPRPIVSEESARFFVGEQAEPTIAGAAVSLRQRARSLAATGLSSEAIADTLGLSVTEVELFTL
jgi:hypothetical protein